MESVWGGEKSAESRGIIKIESLCVGGKSAKRKQLLRTKEKKL